jgi:hypothetical protein
MYLELFSQNFRHSSKLSYMSLKICLLLTVLIFCVYSDTINIVTNNTPQQGPLRFSTPDPI